ncbi:LytTR family DNA-binding domain-containing protein [Galbibacter sp. EGI 63066]|uniref:LytR/AlgR family response regulator transcription factor n=1 Tax=Galbibacter sp. EGI 63066 TaxID=2993559 RepID=UPI002248856A|nr:LytTR family DNA-binding domain-containing protein [Galbibacter sp. EGI 63066]MCX2679844.1 LytTR family DNA-binding domain-containing protein [Galbibacter sp. EGI 63066]
MNKIDFVRLEEILYCKSNGRYTIFFLVGNKELVSSINLGKYENLLDSDFFYRVHKSYIVNLMHVSSISRKPEVYCNMVNGTLVPIAKRRLKRLFKFLDIERS